MKTQRGHVMTMDLINSLRLAPGKMMVVGCCEDPLSDEYTSQGWDVSGYDFRPFQDVDRKLLHPTFKFFQGDFCEMTLPDSHFDVVVDVSAIHHFGLGWYGDPKDVDADNLKDAQAVDKVFKALKPGGYFACMTEVGVWEPKGGTSSNGSHGHWRRYGKKELRERVIQGFDVVKEEYWNRDGLTKIDEETAYQTTVASAIVCLILKKP